MILALLLAVTPAQLAHRVQHFYAHTKDFSAKFAQRRSSAALGRVEESSGTVRVKKPGLVRWDYEKPEAKSIYVEGKTLWMYFPEDKQAQVTHAFAGDQISSAFSFLWGQGDLLKDFKPEKPGAVEGLPKGDLLALVPKKPLAGVERLLFVVGKDGQVLASVVTNPQGDVNQIVFTEPKVDQGLAADLFHFEPPKGTFVQNL